MKKLLAVLLALVMVLSLAACGAAPAETPNTPAEPETPATEPAAEPETPAATGSVYYLNFKPEADKAWQKLVEARRSREEGQHCPDRRGSKGSHRRFRHL